MRFCCCCSSFAVSFPMVDICIRYVCIVYMRGVPAGFAERGGSKTFNRKIIIMPMVFYLSVTKMCILKFGESFLIVRHFVTQVYISYRLLGMTLYIIAIDAYFRVLMTDQEDCFGSISVLFLDLACFIGQSRRYHNPLGFDRKCIL